LNENAIKSFKQHILLGWPVRRNISAGLKIAPGGFSPEISSPPATLFRAKIRRGGENNVAPLK